MITVEELAIMLHQMPKPQPVFYRLYHDEQGRPLSYSMEDLPGTYIEIDQATFVQSSPWVRIRDGKLQSYQPWINTKKLQPAVQGTACWIEDITIVTTDEINQRWSVRHHDTC